MLLKPPVFQSAHCKTTTAHPLWLEKLPFVQRISQRLLHRKECNLIEAQLESHRSSKRFERLTQATSPVHLTQSRSHGL